MKQIAFISLGHIGTPMTINLFKADYLLNVLDLVQGTVDGLVAAGTSTTHSARDAVQGADVVISMLPTNQHVGDLCLDDSGLLAHTAPGTLVLEYSTIAPTSARKIYAATREHDLAMPDAPVSGGTAGAAAGVLTFMVGGDVGTLGKARPLFKAMGRSIFHAGPDSAGQVAKVCNSQLLAMLMVGAAEAMALGVANDLETKVLAEIMRRSSGGNWTLEVYNPWLEMIENALASHDYNGGFMAQLMAKDLGLAQEAARASASSTSVDSLALSLYRLLLKQGYVEWDLPVVQKLFGPTQGQQTNRRVHAQAGRFDDARSPP